MFILFRCLTRPYFVSGVGALLAKEIHCGRKLYEGSLGMRKGDGG